MAARGGVDQWVCSNCWVPSALLFRRPRGEWAGIGLFALTVLVTPVHVSLPMLQQPELFAVPYWALVLRLPLQLALLALIAWSSFAPAASARRR